MQYRETAGLASLNQGTPCTESCLTDAPDLISCGPEVVKNDEPRFDVAAREAAGSQCCRVMLRENNRASRHFENGVTDVVDQPMCR